jgi:hypothetical protein
MTTSVPKFYMTAETIAETNALGFRLMTARRRFRAIVKENAACNAAIAASNAAIEKAKATEAANRVTLRGFCVQHGSAA